MRRSMRASGVFWRDAGAAVLIAGFALPARGQLLPNADVPADIVGCGKAFKAAVRPPFDPMAIDLPEGVGDAMSDTDVLHNDLRVEVLSAAFPIVGSNTFTIRSLVPDLTTFTFRLGNNLTITSALINDSVPVTVQTLSATTRMALLDQTYGVDDVFNLTIEYHGTPMTLGFGSIVYAAHGPRSTPIVSTLSEPYFSYTWWPAKDGDFGVEGDNSDKATFDISITAPAAYTSVSNGVLLEVEFFPIGNRLRYHYHTDYPMVTYLACFATTNYTHWTTTYSYPGGTMPLEFYIWPESDTQANRAAWQNVSTMLTTLRPLYGEYPFIDEHYGMYQFTFNGAEEHQTMTGIGGFWESVIVHELGHQWWGDLVTCRTWHDIWLNEGFATYTEALWAEHKPGSSGLAALLAAMAARRPNDVSGTVYVEDNELSNYALIFSGDNSYRKAAWVLHQLRHVVGDVTFFAILAAYRDAHAFGSATTTDFQNVASSIYGADLGWFFNEWVYGPGAPAYAYGWQTVMVRGQRYLLVSIDQTQQASWGVFTMPVDLRVDFGGGPSQTVTVWNNADPQWYVIPVSMSPVNVVFDEFDWILHTADTLVGYQNGPTAIVSTSPAPESVLDALSGPAELSVFFSVAAIVSADDFQITDAAGGDLSFQFTYDAAAKRATLTLDDGELETGHYTIRVRDTLTSAVSGLSLDGEIAAGALPSGDGVPGGDAVYDLDVAALGDADVDLDIDLADYAILHDCLGGRGAPLAQPECGLFDFDVDNDVDLVDVGSFCRAFDP